MLKYSRTKANNTEPANTRSHSPSTSDVPWTQVVGRGKQKNKRQMISFKPTIAQPVRSSSESNLALSDQPAPAPVELVRPFLKGAEKGSVFIDITHIKDHTLLRAALDNFNKDAETTGRGYNEFLGRCEKTRTYLNHVFMETLWTHQSDSYNTIVNDGIMLSDNTFVKGFPSYSADSNIVRLTIENLPFLPFPILKADFEKQMARFGEVLDFGISKKDGYYMGHGFATIQTPTGTACQHESPCSQEHKHYEALQRSFLWEEDDGDLRKILLTWDAMPDFCRICGSTDHCRADCPDFRSWLKCYNCNKTGHIWKHCPRNHDVDAAPSKTRAVAADTKKSTRKTPLKINNSTASPMIVDPHPSYSESTVPPLSGYPEDQDQSTGQPNPNAIAANNIQREQDAISVKAADSQSNEPADQEMNDGDIPRTKYTYERSVSPDPLAIQKVHRTKNSPDVTSGRHRPVDSDTTGNIIANSTVHDGTEQTIDLPDKDQSTTTNLQ